MALAWMGVGCVNFMSVIAFSNGLERFICWKLVYSSTLFSTVSKKSPSIFFFFLFFSTSLILSCCNSSSERWYSSSSLSLFSAQSFSRRAFFILSSVCVFAFLLIYLFKSFHGSLLYSSVDATNEKLLSKSPLFLFFPNFGWYWKTRQHYKIK